MAIYINADDCINCGACEPECPNTAIYEGGTVWSLGDTKYEESQSPGNFKGDFGKLIIIISFQINAQNAKHFMMNHNALQCAL